MMFQCVMMVLCIKQLQAERADLHVFTYLLLLCISLKYTIVTVTLGLKSNISLYCLSRYKLYIKLSDQERRPNK